MQRAGLVFLMVTLIPGCSFIGVHGPPPKQEWSQPDTHRNTDCTDSTALPVLDLTTGVVTLLLVLGYMSAHSAMGSLANDYDTEDKAVLGSSAVLGLTYITSSILGTNDVDDCKKFKEARLKWLKRTDENAKPTPSPPSQTP